MHGSNALLSIQQTHREISDKLWNICFSHNLVHTPVRELIRQNWKPVYHSNSLYDRIKLPSPPLGGFGRRFIRP